MSRYILIILLLICCNVNANVEFEITVGGEDKEYIENSIVSLAQKHGAELTETHYVPKSGRLTITLPNDDLWFLTVSAPNYIPLIEAVFPKDVTEFSAEVTLRPIAYKDEIKEIRVIHSDADFEFDETLLMTKRKDGRYHLTHETNSAVFKYFFFGAAQRPTMVNGQVQDSFEYNDRGHFNSVINVENGLVEIVFDPALGAEKSEESTIIFTDDVVKQRAAVLNEFSGFQDQWRTDLKNYKNEHGKTDGFEVDQTAIMARIDALISDAEDEVIRDIAHIAFSFLHDDHVEYTQQAIEHLGIDNPAWSLGGGKIVSQMAHQIGSQDEDIASDDIYLNGIRKQPDFFNSFLERSQVHNARKELIFVALYSHKMQQNMDQARAYLKLLKEDYPGDMIVKLATDLVGDNLALKVGASIPNFEFSEMNENTSITKESLKDKVYLIDLWATWCSPCLEELPYLTEVYEEYSDKGFDIVSIAMWDDAEDIKEFQNKHWKMPWKNVFVSSEDINQVAKLLEVKFLPKVMLVDQNGEIIAMNSEVKKEKLETTVKNALGID